MNRLTQRLLNGVIKRTDVKGDSVMNRLAVYEDIGPPSDLIRPVRCGECAYANHTPMHRVNLVCERFKTGGYTHVMNPDDFCSYGERKAAE